MVYSRDDVLPQWIVAWRKYFDCWSYHVITLEDELWIRQREKLSPNGWSRFFKNQTEETEFSVFEFWGQLGSVFRKPICNIFITFCTPIASAYQWVVWLCGNAFILINKATPYRARLLYGWDNYKGKLTFCYDDDDTVSSTFTILIKCYKYTVQKLLKLVHRLCSIQTQNTGNATVVVDGLLQLFHRLLWLLLCGTAHRFLHNFIPHNTTGTLLHMCWADAVHTHLMAALFCAKWRHGHHLQSMMSYQILDSVNWCVFTSRTATQVSA